MSNLIIPLSPRSNPDTNRLGGKGANLIHLMKAGFNVPSGFILSTDLFNKYYRDNSKSSEAISTNLYHLIDQALHDYSTDTAFAVRSSGSDEDASDTSFAGQHDTILNVVGIENLVKAVCDCWSSIDNTAAKAYRESQVTSDQSASMAVVIQKMVDAKCAGVMFTRHPVRPDLDHIVIESVTGLGESLVSGEVNPDRIELDWNGNRVREEVNSEQGNSSFTQLGNVDFVDIARQLEHYYNSPQDIEWAYDGGRFWLLQARPITTLKRPERVWNRIWGDEFWAEATTPLQYTCLGRWIREEYFGAVARIQGYTHLLDGEPFRRIHSHIYFSSNYFYSFLPLVPKELRIPRFFGWLPPYWVAEIDKAPQQKFTAFLGPIKARIADRNASMISHYKYLDDYIAKVKRAYHGTLADDLSQLGDKEIWQRMLRADSFGVEHFRFIRWGMGTYLFPLKLMLIRRGMDWASDPSGEETEMLLTADADNQTLQVNQQLQKLSALATQNIALKELLVRGEGKVSLSDVMAISGTDEFVTKYRGFIAEHGHRGTTRELNSPRWMEDSSLVLGLVAAYAGHGQTIAEIRPKKQDQLTQSWLNKIQHSHPLWGRFRKWMCQYLLKLCRAYVEYRENQRYALDYIITEMRLTMLEISKRLTSAGFLVETDDVFFLEFDEVQQLWAAYQNKGNFHLPDIEKRRADYLNDARELPADWIIDGIEYGKQFDKTCVDQSGLLGTGASNGKVVGKARIIQNPHELSQVKEGEIMVAPNTDPGWTPVFPLIKGLILQTGGMLSHGAIVAREYQIPAVTGVPDACKLIQTGDIVEVNGSSGRVQIKEKRS